MREHSVNKLNNFIGGWYINDLSLCDDIINYHKNNPFVTAGFINDSDNGGSIIDVKAKNSIECRLNESPSLMNRYLVELQSVINCYIEMYPYSNICEPYRNIEPTNIQYYPPGGGYYTWHSERLSGNNPETYRHLVYMTYLNDVTDAGETEFMHQQLKIKPEKGLTLMWGTDWTFTHRGIASPTQDKYITTGWLSFYKD